MNLETVKLCRWLVMLSVWFVLTACIAHASHFVIEPIAPESHGFWNLKAPVVDSLRPVFRWKLLSGNPSAAKTYDFILYEGVSHGNDYGRWSPGPVVVYCEGLSQPEFHLDMTLTANRVYIWSVRVREGRKISNWANYSYQTVSPVPGAVLGSESGLPFIFKTPEIGTTIRKK